MNRLVYFITIIVTIIILSYPTISNSNTSGSVGAKTGSPSDGSSCTQCHYSATGSGATITSNIPTDGYIPGNVYTINVSITESGKNKFGFEITSEENNFGSAKTGTFIVTNNTETKLVNNDNAITHTASGTTGSNNTKDWSFDWQAPGFPSSTGSVIFYAAFIGANGDGGNSGDTYHTANLTINETTATYTTNMINKRNFIFNPISKQIESINNNELFIYNTEGKLILQSKKKQTSLSKLIKGIYIIKAGRDSQKIAIY